MPGLGRRLAPDVRDHRFRLTDHPRAQQIVARRSRIWPMFARPLDQGNTGTCVGHAWRHRLTAAPVLVRATVAPSAFEIYDQAVAVDEWTDNDHDTDRQWGTSVRAGAKVLQAMTRLTEYRWTTSVDEAADWIVGIDREGKYVGGPVVIGVDFFASMFDLDADGYMHADMQSGLAGGHCMMLIGWDDYRGRFRGVNSWGYDWGQHGRFWLDGEAAQRLFSADGEVCIPTERVAV